MKQIQQEYLLFWYAMLQLLVQALLISLIFSFVADFKLFPT